MVLSQSSDETAGPRPLTERECKTPGLGELISVLKNTTMLTKSSLDAMVKVLGNVHSHLLDSTSPSDSALKSTVSKLYGNVAVYRDFQKKNYEGSDELALTAESYLEKSILADRAALLAMIPDEVKRTGKTLEKLLGNPRRREWSNTLMQKLRHSAAVALVGVLALVAQDTERTPGDRKRNDPTPDHVRPPEAPPQQNENPAQERAKGAEVPPALEQAPIEKKQGPDLHFLRNQKDVHQPDINAADLAAAGAREGERAIQLPIAEVRDLLPELRGQLWTTATYGLDADRKLILHYSLVQKTGDDICGRVIIGGEKGIAVAKGQRISLPRPVGYAAKTLTVEPPVAHEFHDRRQDVTFLEDARSVRIEYTIAKAENVSFHPAIGFREGRDTWTLIRPEGTNENLRALRGLRGADIQERQKKILAAELSDYTYITSRQLDMLIQALAAKTGRATTEEVTVNIRMGDCDTLARDISGLQKDSSVWIGRVHVGIQEQGGALNGNNLHAVADVSEMPFETTDKVRASYEHVQFLPEDLNELLAIVQAVPENPTNEQRKETYEKFRTALTRILQKEHYQQFCNKTVMQLSFDDALRALSRAWEGLKKWVSESFTEKNQWRGMGVAVLFLIAAIAALYAAARVVGKTASTLYDRLYDRPQKNMRIRSAIRHREYFVALFNGMETKIPEPLEDDSKERAQLIGQLYRDYDHAPLENFLPRAEVNALPPARQRLLLKMITIWPMASKNWNDDYIFFDKLRSALKMRRENRRILAEMGKKEPPTHFQDFVDDCRRASVNTHKEAYERGKVLERAMHILQVAREMAENTAGPITMKRSQNPPVTRTGTPDLRKFSQRTVRDTRSQPQGNPFDSRLYTPGDDVRHLDWAAYARTDKLTLRERERESPLTQQQAVPVLVDVFHMGNNEVMGLAALLLLMQQGKCDFTVESITAMAHGTLAKTNDQSRQLQFSSPMIQQVLADKKGDALRVLVEQLLQAHIQSNFLMNTLTRDDVRTEGGTTLQRTYSSGAGELALAHAEQHRPSILVGLQYYDTPESDFIRSIDIEQVGYGSGRKWLIAGVFTDEERKEYNKQKKAP